MKEEKEAEEILVGWQLLLVLVESRGLFGESAKQTCEFHIEARCSFEIFSNKKQKNMSLVIAYWS